MIKITILYNENKFASLEVKGHANSAEYGQDIVCSAVSALIFGGLSNILNEENYEHYDDEKKGYFQLECISKNSDHDKVVIETVIAGIRKIQKEYPKNVRLEEREMKGNK